MTDINLKTETPDTTLPTTGFLFGADSQAAASPSVFTVQSVATTLLGSTTLSGATITANAPVLNLEQTWNNAAVTFTGLKANVTDTASNAASLLMDLQVGGASRFSVRKDGRATFSQIFQEFVFTNTLAFVFSNTSSTSRFNFSGAAMLLGSGGTIGWKDDVSSGSGTTDLILSRRGAANLRFGMPDAAAPVAQTLSVQSVVAGTTNIAGANLTITGSQGTGTGAGGSIIFQVAPAGSSGTAQNALATFLEATSARAFNLYNTTDVTTNFERGFIKWESNALRIGAEKGGTGTDRALEFFVGSAVRLTIAINGGATFQAGIFGGGEIRAGAGSSIHFNGRSRFNSPSDGIVQLVNAAQNDFNRLQFGGTTSSFPALKRSSASLIVRLADDSANADLESASLKTDAPAGGTAATWKLGAVATVTPTLQNRTIEVDIGGTIYYISAKTTND
jgi:hypothetical protein